MRRFFKSCLKPDSGFVLIGSDEDAADVRSELSAQGISCPIHHFTPDMLTEDYHEMAGAAAVCCVPCNMDKGRLATLYQYCQENSITLCFSLPGLSVLQRNMQVGNLGFLAFMQPRTEPLSLWYNRVWKRFFDLFLSFMFLFCFFPFVYIVAGIIIKSKSAGPVFSVSKIVGRKGKVVERYAFRTADLPQKSILCKSRIKCSPQMLNVFWGSMSMVGASIVEARQEVPSQTVLRYVRPGVVNCTWCRDADVWYTQNWSLWLDLCILVEKLFHRKELS